MKKLRQFIECFVTVATGILIIAALSYPSRPADLTPAVLWQILLSAGLCSVSTVLFFPDDTATRLQIYVGVSLHFISLCVIMVVCGRWFGWVGPGFWDAFGMIVEVIIIYAFTTGITYIMEKRQAAEMDQQLKKKYSAAPDSEEK